VLGKIVLILGILGILLGGGVLLVSALLPTLTEGRTSMDEALLGIIPGAIVLIGSFFLAIIGIVVMLMTRKKTRTTTP
jgi:Na+-transporting NADH:ubiquinone oxidoreductase subunit NqrD